MAVTGGILAVIGAGASIDASKAQARSAKREKIASSAMEFSKRARERRAALKEKRIRTAQLRAASAATGVTGSSGELGTEAVLSTNFASNVGFGAGLQAGRDAIGAAQVSAARAGLKGAYAGAVQSMGMNIFSNYGGFKGLQSKDELLTTDGELSF